jgi:hypothetical protein
MLIRDISMKEVKAGRTWRVADSHGLEMLDWTIEPVADSGNDDTIVYSALAVLRTDDVRPLLVIREVGTYEWWGDTLEYVHGTWREFQAGGDEGAWATAETYVAAPLPNDPSFVGEYSHDMQRAGFARWCERLHE